MRFQFTHPGKGATPSSVHQLSRLASFNSRTLGRVRHLLRGEYALIRLVSIHAPWEWCDRRTNRIQASRICFNSRTLGRVRLINTLVIRKSHRSFNSRTLGRVRRVMDGSAGEDTEVSIHAPWEGCDIERVETSCPGLSFNSRTLGRVRLDERKQGAFYNAFQFTHPGKGATYHSPIYGAGEVGFNSRTLGRVRRISSRREIPYT